LLQGLIQSTQGSKQLHSLVAVDNRLQTVSLCLATDFGAWSDLPGREGTAHLLEHLLIYSPLRAGSSLSDRISERGGYCNAETHADGMVFSVQVHPDEADIALELMLEAVFTPSVDETSLSRERQAVLRELTALEADPSDLVQRSFVSSVLGEHPLACPVGGTNSSVEGITIDHAISAHRQHFLNSTFTLVSVGPKTPDAVHQDIGQPGTRGPASSHVPKAKIPRLQRQPPEWTGDFAWMCVGAAAPSVTSKRRPAFNVLEFMLGSRSTSLLNRRLRVEQSLAYVFEAWYRGYSGAGTWSVIAGAETRHGDDIVSAVRDCLADVASGRSSPDSFEVARRQAVMQVLRESESPFDQALQIARKAKSGYVSRGTDAETSLLASVSFEDVREAAKSILDDLTIVVESEA